MQHFAGRVAVITGAASGMGRSLAFQCAREGMRIVAADINEQSLAQVEGELRATGAEVVALPTDVSQADDIEKLADRTLSAFGAIHLLFNNAGVARLNRTWEVPLPEWEWHLNTNLWSVIYAIHTFVPILLAQADESHIVNTASIAGLFTSRLLGAYTVSKHGVVALSEVLYHELAQESDRVKVSVLCPGFVNTALFDTSLRNRPASVVATPNQHRSALEQEAEMRAAVVAGTSPDEIAAMVFAAIRAERFYILPHPDFNEAVQRRMEDIINTRNPSPM